MTCRGVVAAELDMAMVSPQVSLSWVGFGPIFCSRSGWGQVQLCGQPG